MSATESSRPDRPLVEVRDASVRFGSHEALVQVSLTVRAGERLALLGSNGSGKTTLLRLLHGQIGHALEDSRSVVREPGMREAMVFQRPFHLRLSVWRNLAVALWLAGVPRAERAARARDALVRVGLEGLRDRPARTLSGGQQQRLALARAWAARPQLLFLDEPTASLDPRAKGGIEGLIGAFADEGMTVVMSTHNLGQAKRLATRVIYLEEGRLICDLPVQAFFEGPLPAAAAAFVRGESV